ncbi:hypothetical protein E4U41_006433 [Claviceps citrina]|nr:hypothetical protein E4U41_006433 [Claviceps citrina]
MPMRECGNRTENLTYRLYEEAPTCQAPTCLDMLLMMCNVRDRDAAWPSKFGQLYEECTDHVMLVGPTWLQEMFVVLLNGINGLDSREKRMIPVVAHVPF